MPRVSDSTPLVESQTGREWNMTRVSTLGAYRDLGCIVPLK